MRTGFISFVILSGAMVLATPASADERVQWTDVPPAAQKTITDNAGGGKIEEVEKETKTRDGKTVTIYEAEVKKPDGKKIEIEVADDGKLIGVKDD